jgi:hypothetical protein
MSFQLDRGRTIRSDLPRYPGVVNSRTISAVYGSLPAMFGPFAAVAVHARQRRGHVTVLATMVSASPYAGARWTNRARPKEQPGERGKPQPVCQTASGANDADGYGRH